MKLKSYKIREDINKLNIRKNALIDSYLDWDIEKDIYKSKLKEYELQIIEKEKLLLPIKKISSEKLKKIEKWSELFVSLYRSYPKLIIEEKLNILKSLWSELLVGTKKELYIAKNRLSELLEKLHFHIWYS